MRAAARTRTEPTEINERDLGRADAIAEAMRVAEGLGLDLHGPLEPGDLIRFVYAQGWQAAEKRMLAPDLADRIDLALRTPAAVLEQRTDESLTQWQVRAIQQIVAAGPAK